MKYCITTVATPELTLEEIVAATVRWGYGGIELRVRRLANAMRSRSYSVLGNYRYDITPDNLATEAPRIRRLCADHGLTIPAITANATLADHEDLRRLAEGAALLDCRLLRLAPPRSALVHHLRQRQPQREDAALSLLTLHRQSAAVLPGKLPSAR